MYSSPLGRIDENARAFEAQSSLDLTTIKQRFESSERTAGAAFDADKKRIEDRTQRRLVDIMNSPAHQPYRQLLPALFDELRDLLLYRREIELRDLVQAYKNDKKGREQALDADIKRHADRHVQFYLDARKRFPVDGPNDPLMRSSKPQTAFPSYSQHVHQPPQHQPQQHQPPQHHPQQHLSSMSQNHSKHQHQRSPNSARQMSPHIAGPGRPNTPQLDPPTNSQRLRSQSTSSSPSTNKFIFRSAIPIPGLGKRRKSEYHDMPSKRPRLPDRDGSNERTSTMSVPARLSQGHQQFTDGHSGPMANMPLSQHFPSPINEPNRSVNFKDIFQDGNPEFKHFIIRFPPGADRAKFYILKCELHGVHFGLSPVQGGAKHLHSQAHYYMPKHHSLAVEKLGFRILDCTQELADKNNEMVKHAHENGYQPLNRKKGLRSGMPTAADYSLARRAHSYSTQRPASRFHGIVRPRPGHLYYAETSEGPGKTVKYAVMILCWGLQDVCGLPGETLDSLKLLQNSRTMPMPACYTVDWETRRIVGWADGYEDGGPFETLRQFPVCWFAHHFHSSYSWVEARWLSPFNLDDPLDANTLHQRARDFFAKSKGFETFKEMRERSQEQYLTHHIPEHAQSSMAVDNAYGTQNSDNYIGEQVFGGSPSVVDGDTESLSSDMGDDDIAVNEDEDIASRPSPPEITYRSPSDALRPNGYSPPRQNLADQQKHGTQSLQRADGETPEGKEVPIRRHYHFVSQQEESAVSPFASPKTSALVGSRNGPVVKGVPADASARRSSVSDTAVAALETLGCLLNKNVDDAPPLVNRSSPFTEKLPKTDGTGSRDEAQRSVPPQQLTPDLTPQEYAEASRSYANHTESNTAASKAKQQPTGIQTPVSAVTPAQTPFNDTRTESHGSVAASLLGVSPNGLR